MTEIGSTLIFVVSVMGYGILLLFYGVLSGFVVTVMGYGVFVGVLVGVGPTVPEFMHVVAWIVPHPL